jgi:hypothetical protein
VALLGLGFVVGRATEFARGLLQQPAHTTISQSSVVQRLQSVSKLVTTEATVRDVVSYQNSWLGSTKRSLVIVTGRALVGLDLTKPPRVTIDQANKRVTLGLPHATLIGVDITDLRTYDERRGLWNPFHPADRDTIYLIAHAQLAHAAMDLAVLEMAETSAKRTLAALFAAEGYTVDVVFEPFLAAPAE